MNNLYDHEYIGHKRIVIDEWRKRLMIALKLYIDCQAASVFDGSWLNMHIHNYRKAGAVFIIWTNWIAFVPES